VVAVKALSGENNGRAKLTQKDVDAIRNRYVWRDHDNGAMAIGKDFGIHFTTVLDIVRGKIWANRP
jgi:hypothetical protein